MKVYMAVPFEAYHGHDAHSARVFTSLVAAECYCEHRNELDHILDWEVVELQVDEELVSN